MENVSIQARPLKVAEEYISLMSKEWLEAKSALQATRLSEAEQINLLFNILMVIGANVILFPYMRAVLNGGIV